jgi:hypothetical protein
MPAVKRPAAILAAVLVILCLSIAYYLYFTGKFDLLILDRHATIKVNGVTVQGEMLVGRGSAIVTRRDANKKHSYLLLIAGDTDATGDMGNVIDCGSWVAPNIPALVEHSDYPPCVLLRHGGKQRRVSLQDKGYAMEFTPEPDVTIVVNRNRIRQ